MRISILKYLPFLQLCNELIQIQQMEYKYTVYILTFLIYVGVHSLRTSYSFNKGQIADVLNIQEVSLGLVDSLMLFALALGYLQQTLFPLAYPVRALTICMILCAIFYAFIPITIIWFHFTSLAILCVLMSLSGYFQSYAWPNILMLVNKQFDNKKQSGILGFWATNTNWGNILGFVICQYIVLSLQMPWQTSMFIISFYIISMAILTFIFVHQIKHEDNQGPLLEHAEISSVSSQSVEIDQSQFHFSLSKMFSSSVVILLTLAFSLLKSVEYGIMLWLPLYFDLIGLVQYSAYIPITFDISSVGSSILLGFAFKYINNKGLLLTPAIFFLVVFFCLLKFLNITVAGYFLLISGVGICLGGSYNTMAGLVAMELVKMVPKKLRIKYLGLYSAILMAFANLITGLTQILIGFVVGKNQSQIFTIFIWYSGFALVLFIIVSLLDKEKPKPHKKREVQIHSF